MTKDATQSNGEQTRLEVEHLIFDQENPRLPPSARGGDESQILDWMLRDSSLFDLMQSIGQDGYFDGEPILVAKTWPGHEQFDGTYVVVEGNRRLAAVKLLAQPELAPRREDRARSIADNASQHPDRVAAIVYGSRGEVLHRVGYRHITGIKEWDSLAKARYLRDLLGSQPLAEDELLERLRELAKRVGAGTRTDYVRKLLDALSVLDFAADRDFWQLKDVSEETFKFSLLSTALSYTNIADWIELRSESYLTSSELVEPNVKDLFEWIFSPTGERGKPVVPESRQLSVLASIVSAPRAVETLRETRSLARARLLTSASIDAYRDSMKAAQQTLDIALRELASASETPTEDDKLLAISVAQVSRSISQLVDSKMNAADDDLA